MRRIAAALYAVAALSSGAPALAQTALGPNESPLLAQLRSEIALCDKVSSNEELTRAIEACTTVIAAGVADAGQRAAAYRRRGNWRRSRGDFEGALADLDLAVRHAPSADDRGRALYAKATIYEIIGREAEMRAALDQAADYAPARVKRAGQRADRKEFAAALADYEAARPKMNLPAEALDNLCWIRAVELKIELATARRDCDAAVQKDPQHGQYLTTRGILNLREGRNQAAFDDFNAGMSLRRASPTTLFGRGLAAARLGMTKRSADDLAKARKASSMVEEDDARYGLKP